MKKNEKKRTRSAQPTTNIKKEEESRDRKKREKEKERESVEGLAHALFRRRILLDLRQDTFFILVLITNIQSECFILGRIFYVGFCE